jgi:hypothetical protein
MNYKDTQNKVHSLDSTAFEYLLPIGSVPITDEEAEALRPKPPTPTYAELRSLAYPPITDQLDTIYHEGIDAWKAVITAVKEEYPKP